jgi:isopentenyldiphosphate isomerase
VGPAVHFRGSVAEHLVPGEEYIDAGHRGLSEELSIEGVLLEPLGDESVGKFEDLDLNIKDYEFRKCFSGVTDKAARVDGVEVVEIGLLTLDDLKKKMRDAPDLFTPWFVEFADRIELFTRRDGTYQ